VTSPSSSQTAVGRPASRVVDGPVVETGTGGSSLAQALRDREPAALVDLLRSRPDLVQPVPTDLAHLAIRATSRPSVLRAVDGLDRWTLQVLQSILALPDPVSVEDLRVALGTVERAGAGTSRRRREPSPDPVAHAVTTLRDTALIWGTDDALQIVRALPEILGPHPAGLAASARTLLASSSPTRVADLAGDLGLTRSGDPVRDADAIARLLAEDAAAAALIEDAVAVAGAGAREVLERLQWGPPTGRVELGDRVPRRADAVTPVEVLVARGLLVATDQRTLTLPLEVALHLRRGRTVASPEPVPPLAAAAPAYRPGSPSGAGRAAAVSPAAVPTGAVPPGAVPPGSSASTATTAPGSTRPSRARGAARNGPPDVATTDSRGLGAVLELLRFADSLVANWEGRPPAVLRAGGVGVRDIRRTAATVGTDDATTALLVEVLGAASLVAEDDDGWLPTAAYDAWAELDPAHRWAALAAAWLAAPRAAGLVGQRIDSDRIAAPLGPDLDNPLAVAVRRAVLDGLAALPPGTGPRTPGAAGPTVTAPVAAAGAPPGGPPVTPPPAPPTAPPPAATAAGAGPVPATTVPTTTAAGAAPTEAASGATADPAETLVLADTAWRLPRRAPRLRDDLARWTLAEAATLGVLGGQGASAALTTWGRALLGHDTQAAVGALAAALPDPVEQVVLQADLTAVAPGMLHREVATELGLLADVESAGAATVYRFSPATIRRALDGGRTSTAIHSFLAAHSATAVPQPLTYLVDDVARRHGAVRVGSVSAYVRCEDPAALAALVADRRVASLRLRALAPTVAVTDVPVDIVLERLRTAGHSPAAEGADGAVVVGGGEARRAPVPLRRPGSGERVLDERMLAAAAAALLAGDRAVRARPRGTLPPPGSEPVGTGALAVLRRALGEESRSGGRLGTSTVRRPEPGLPVWIGYTDSTGTVGERIVEPVRIDGGVLTALDRRDAKMRTFALHRITAAALVDDDGLGVDTIDPASTVDTARTVDTASTVDPASTVDTVDTASTVGATGGAGAVPAAERPVFDPGSS